MMFLKFAVIATVCIAAISASFAPKHPTSSYSQQEKQELADQLSKYTKPLERKQILKELDQDRLEQIAEDKFSRAEVATATELKLNRLQTQLRRAAELCSQEPSEADMHQLNTWLDAVEYTLENGAKTSRKSQPLAPEEMTQRTPELVKPWQMARRLEQLISKVYKMMKDHKRYNSATLKFDTEQENQENQVRDVQMFERILADGKRYNGEEQERRMRTLVQTLLSLTEIKSSEYGQVRFEQINERGEFTQLKLERINRNLKTKFIVGGFLQDHLISRQWVKKMTEAIQAQEQEPVNFIYVDWSAYNYFPYMRAVTHTKTVGKQLANTIAQLVTKYGVSEEQIHLIGSGLGAHICGEAGQRLQKTSQEIESLLELANGKNNKDGQVEQLEKSKPIKIARITALQPTEKLINDLTEEDHLTRKDAHFVEIIRVVDQEEKKKQQQQQQQQQNDDEDDKQMKKRGQFKRRQARNDENENASHVEVNIISEDNDDDRRIAEPRVMFQAWPLTSMKDTVSLFPSKVLSIYTHALRKQVQQPHRQIEEQPEPEQLIPVPCENTKNFMGGRCSKILNANNGRLYISDAEVRKVKAELASEKLFRMFLRASQMKPYSIEYFNVVVRYTQPQKQPAEFKLKLKGERAEETVNVDQLIATKTNDKEFKTQIVLQNKIGKVQEVTMVNKHNIFNYVQKFTKAGNQAKIAEIELQPMHAHKKYFKLVPKFNNEQANVEFRMI